MLSRTGSLFGCVASFLLCASVGAFQFGHAPSSFHPRLSDGGLRLSRGLPDAKPRTASIRMASGIDALPLATQTAIFFGTMSGITAGGLVVAGPVLDGAKGVLGKQRFDAWSYTWSLLCVVFLGAGVSHFTSAAAFEGIYPPVGTWGIWALPGSKEFHVAWTGVAEILGGAGLLAGSLSEVAPETVRMNLRQLRKASAAALFLLTVCVTPANIYMWTHNVPLVGLGPPGDIPVNFHYVRLSLQILILGFLGRMAIAPLEEEDVGSST